MCQLPGNAQESRSTNQITAVTPSTTSDPAAMVSSTTVAAWVGQSLGAPGAGAACWQAVPRGVMARSWPPSTRRPGSVRLVLNDFGPTDVPDVTPRSPEALASLTDEANEHCGQAHYSLARHDVGSLLAESQACAVTVPAARSSRAWRLAEGATVYEDVTAALTAIAVLGSRERSSSLHFDLARVLAQEDSPRDADVIRHLDTADRIAPQRIRGDPWSNSDRR
ncbi:MAG: hypothetical protein ABIZ05_05290 [Pseudonocardiaceae bacterium]